MAPHQLLYTDCCSSTAGYGELRCAGYVYAHSVHVLTLAHLHCTGRGPPTLKVLAGAALRQHVMDSCKAIKDVLVQHDHLPAEPSE